MSTPPRRRRTETPRRSNSGGGGGWLPTIAMGLGVIVAGLGIGALVAVLMQRGSNTAPVAVVTATPSPLATTGRPPVAIATIEPPRRTRTAAPSVAPQATPVESAEPSPSPSPSAPTSPSPSPSASAAPSPRPTRVVALAASPSPSPSATAQPTPEPAAMSSTTPIGSAPQPTATPASTYDQRASAVVRRYLDALIAGDDATAYAALGAAPGSGTGELSEQAFLDPGARIVTLKVTRIDAANATVGCEIATAKGRYYATYHVTASANGPYISAHDYIKVST